MIKTKIAAIGENDVMKIFGAVGAEIFPVPDKDEAEKTLAELVKSGFGMIFITESIAEQINDMIKEYSSGMLPSIIVVPGLKGSGGYAVERLRQSIIKAVGADVMKEK